VILINQIEPFDIFGFVLKSNVTLHQSFEYFQDHFIMY